MRLLIAAIFSTSLGLAQTTPAMRSIPAGLAGIQNPLALPVFRAPLEYPEVPTPGTSGNLLRLETYVGETGLPKSPSTEKHDIRIRVIRGANPLTMVSYTFSWFSRTLRKREYTISLRGR